MSSGPVIFWAIIKHGLPHFYWLDGRLRLSKWLRLVWRYTEGLARSIRRVREDRILNPIMDGKYQHQLEALLIQRKETHIA